MLLASTSFKSFKIQSDHLVLIYSSNIILCVCVLKQLVVLVSQRLREFLCRLSCDNHAAANELFYQTAIAAAAQTAPVFNTVKQ